MTAIDVLHSQQHIPLLCHTLDSRRWVGPRAFEHALSIDVQNIREMPEAHDDGMNDIFNPAAGTESMHSQ